MTPDFSLAHLTVINLTPPEVVSVAGRAGYRFVGLRFIGGTPETPAYPLMSDRPMLRETKARLGDTGLRLLDVEFLRFAPETEVRDFVPVLEAGAELGAKHAIAAAYDPDRSRLIERFAALCDLAAPLGIVPVLEFFPWTDVNNLATATAVVEAAGRENAGVLVDVLHFDRSDSSFGELDALPASRLPFLHLCDAPAEKPVTTEGLLHTARLERLPPPDRCSRLVAAACMAPTS